MNNTLSFPNKNLYRKYPFRSTCTLLANEGHVLPLTAISCAKLFSPYNEVFVRKIIVRNGFLNLIVTAVDDGGSLQDLAYIHVKLTSDFQTVPVTPISRAAGGSITFGLKEDVLGLPEVSTFERGVTRIEDSLVVKRSAPEVDKIVVKGISVTGQVGLVLSNLRMSVNPDDFELGLEVDRGQLLTASADGDLGKGICPFLPLSTINGVTPDSNGNIDIYCISPLAVHVLSDGVKIASPAFSLEDACSGAKNNVPVAPANSPDTYPAFMYTDSEEWRNWPQYA